MERLAYIIKYRLPILFPVIEAVAHKATRMRYGRLFARVVSNARMTGTIAGRAAEIRVLKPRDECLLSEYLMTLDEEHLRFFRPHGFEVKSIRSVLNSGAYLTYGLFVEGEMISYAFLKATPTGSLYFGRVVSRQFCGKGIGKFLGDYLTWQASLTGR